jgi:two-component system OmpR family response regulator
MIKSPVLIIDDEKDICFLLGKVLDKKNYRVDIAHNLTDGLAKLIGTTYSILFLDIRLPDGSGLETLPKIKIQNPLMKVVIMSAYDGNLERKQALESGADLFLGKPLSSKIILEALHSLQTESTEPKIKTP